MDKYSTLLRILSPYPESVLRIRSIFSRIRIRDSGLKNTDPDPGDLKKTGSGSYLDIFLMFSKINNFLRHFLTNSEHHMTPKIKDKKSYLDETVFETYLYNEKI